tara:strand:+ start:237 stop:668 length:432 start_codon:yes stop_codon:yes gene_type:complete
MKKLISLLIVIFFYGCGFKPIYSSKDVLFKVDQINYDYNKINSQIARSIKTLSNNEAKRTLEINIKSNKERKIVSKTKNGDPEIFELVISVEISTYQISKTFLSKQNYNNIDNKFELNQYELEVEKQIISELTGKILNYLTNV